jgi:hypothetical protein
MDQRPSGFILKQNHPNQPGGDCQRDHGKYPDESKPAHSLSQWFRRRIHQ